MGPIQCWTRQACAVAILLVGISTCLDPPSAAAEECPNEGVRLAQHSTFLPECRAFEQVSPAQKNGGSVDTTKTIQSSPDGDAVAFSSPAAFAGAQASLSGGYFLSRRESADWATEAIDQPQDNPSYQVTTPTLWLTEDLGKAMQFSNKALLPGAETGANLYLRDNLTGGLTLAMATDQGVTITNSMVNATIRYPVFATPDLDHFVFTAEQQLRDENGVLLGLPETRNTFEVTPEGLRLVSVLDGAPVSAALTTYTAARGTFGISTDGRKIVFQSPSEPADGPLYLRIDGSTTIPVSVSEVAGEDPGPYPAFFKYMDPAGKFIIFSTPFVLVDGAEPVGGYGSLYRFDIDTEEVTLVANGDVASLLTSTVDGEYLYSTTTSRLALSVIRQGVVDEFASFSFLSGNFGEFAMSPSGRYFAFDSYGEPTGYDNTAPPEACPGSINSGGQPGFCKEVYLYDAVEDSLVCVSCVTFDGNNKDSGLSDRVVSVSNYRPRSVTDDGAVHFDSEARLVASDINGRGDVYRWRDGEIALLSPGTAAADAEFADATPDGSSVFFLTAEGIVAQDDDGATDLYRAAVGGGIPGQNVRRLSLECVEEACKGAAAPVPAVPAAATSTFVGPPSKSSAKQRKPRKKFKQKRCGGRKQRVKGSAKKCSGGGSKNGKAKSKHAGTRGAGK